MTDEASIGVVEPLEARRLVAAGEAVLVDIRESDEVARLRIEGALARPAGTSEGPWWPRTRTPIFMCASGARTAAQIGQLSALAGGRSLVLKGGLDAWRRAGLPVVEDRRAPLPIMRQVQIVAGSLVLAGVALAALVSPWFMTLSAFVGAGLVLAGVTGFCGMARLLTLMPWNAGAGRQASPSSARAAAAPRFAAPLNGPAERGT